MHLKCCNILTTTNSNNFHYLSYIKFIQFNKYHVSLSIFIFMNAFFDILYYDELIIGNFNNDIMSSVLYFVTDKINTINPPKNKITDNE